MNLEATDITLAGNVNLTGNVNVTGNLKQANPDVTLPTVNTTDINTYVHPDAVAGSMVLNTNNNKVYVWTGSSWVALN